MRCAEMLKSICETVQHAAGCPYTDLCSENQNSQCLTDKREYRAANFDSIPRSIIDAEPELKAVAPKERGSRR